MPHDPKQFPKASQVIPVWSPGNGLGVFCVGITFQLLQLFNTELLCYFCDTASKGKNYWKIPVNFELKSFCWIAQSFNMDGSCLDSNDLFAVHSPTR